ncbi:MAG: glycosyltransferase family 4 protein [Pseudobutyrivibrio sp.]|nr:glycosyltransferase family 4 protein [Pseudobutyrivibrio sp.]
MNSSGKKIIILANNSGGLYLFRKELISALIASGNEVVAYTPFDAHIDALKDLGIGLHELNIDRRGINPVKDYSLLKSIRKIIKEERPDLVITYTIKPNVYGGIVCRMMHVPYVINITGLGTAFQNEGIIKKIATFLYRVACKRAKVVFFENAGNRNIFVDNRIVAIEKTHVLNGAGVNTEFYALQEYPKEEKVVFLFIGRIMREKGIDELLAASAKLAKEGYDFQLAVLGRFEEDYSDIFSKYEAEGWLKNYGYTDDVRAYIKNAHCFVLPSWHEGMANTNLECASSGRPVITSNIHGCMEAVEDGVSGFLVKRKDVDSLYAAMKKFISLSYDERREMGLKGRNRMESIFDKKVVVKDTIDHMI